MPVRPTLCSLGSPVCEAQAAALAGTELSAARRGGRPGVAGGLDLSLVAEVAPGLRAAGNLGDGGRRGPCWLPIPGAAL